MVWRLCFVPCYGVVSRLSCPVGRVGRGVAGMRREGKRCAVEWWDA